MSGLLHTVIAQAGGGSGGFSGGGGGGFSGGGGGGFSGGGSGGGGGGFGFLIVVLIIAVVVISGSISAARERRARARRVRAVELASGEAAQDDAYLAADRVNREAADLYVAVQAAWDARDQDRLAQLVAEDLMVEWRRRLDDFARRGWHNRVRLLSAPRVEYVGLVNREDDSEDRVTVRISARMESYVETNGRRIMKTGEGDETISIVEFWTLARNGDAWMCVSIEQVAEGAHHLHEPIVATPDADTERIRGDAVTELAVAEAVPAGFTTADLAVLDFEGTARDESLDLSVQDGRFAPDVLEVAARRAVGAWAEAVDGADDALTAIASPEAAKALLYGSDTSERTRLVLRGPAVKRIAIAELTAENVPATMALDVELAAVRYVEDRDTTTVVSGAKNSATTFTQRWTLSLDGPDTAPWRLTGVRA